MATTASPAARETMFCPGNNGDDTLDGGTGNDLMTGGANTDTSNYSNRTGALQNNARQCRQ